MTLNHTFCSHCGKELVGNPYECPFCQGKLAGPPGRPRSPAATIVLSVLLVAFVVAMLVGAVVNAWQDT